MKKYLIIKQYIEQQFNDGHLKQGQKLPSIRDMSENFNCSKATVIKAYQELENKHIIYSVPQSGYYAVSEETMDEEMADKSVMDFSSAAPSSETLPYKDFQHCLNMAIDLYEDTLFSYSPQKGLQALVKTLHKQFCDYHIFTREKNIFITTGTQQAINILFNMKFPNGKRNVLLEQPTYHGALQALKLSNAKAIGIERSFKSIDLNKLEYIFKNEDIKCFYTIPRYSNPLGLSYTMEEKRDIIRLADKYNVYIIEDDYLADLEVDSKNDSMLSLDPERKVIYLKSFSKILLPGLRIGAAIIPDELVSSFSNYKKWSDLSTPVLSQGALHIYIKNGLFNLHKKKLTDIYSRRMTLVKKMLSVRTHPQLTCADSYSGFFIGIASGKDISNRRIINNLSQMNINIKDCSQCFIDSSKSRGLFRVSVCRVNDEEIFKGIPIIADVISGAAENSNSIFR
ncbi:PLP-dependent aminotransferase family protein [Clostridium oryzae]|uniref:2-aminoadipate transaminase n=1 Tax=Clostridium oryzae TaxID=1450648 RepID=A0A1V4IT56_9CLOT|nr:PLP-dependent aminotransferase family protein [Clostridium oryzae]OPJ63093.1 2-aminoadipate transaminase [Clostridium oryzae]